LRDPQAGVNSRSRIAAVLSFTQSVLALSYVFVMVRPQIPFLPAVIAPGLFAGLRGTFAFQRLPRKPQDLPTIEERFQSVKSSQETPDRDQQSS